MNEFYRIIRMGVAGYVRDNRTETDSSPSDSQEKNLQKRNKAKHNCLMDFVNVHTAWLTDLLQIQHILRQCL